LRGTVAGGNRLIDQHANFLEAIRHKRARNLVIESLLAQPLVATDRVGRLWRKNTRGRQRLAEEKVRNERAIAELEAEDARLLALKRSSASGFSSGTPEQTRARKVRARRHDPRKEAIRALKHRNPRMTALEICGKMNLKAERDPLFDPPKSWGTKLWTDAYRKHSDKVSTYISKIKPA
jgi:hypothetical protein